MQSCLPWKNKSGKRKKHPTAVVNTDTRTPQQIIGSIETQGRIVSGALTKLTALMAAD
jgi:type I restriction enzyme M protein